MTESEQKKFTLWAKVMKAMAHSTRLYIVDLLRNGEKCVCEINERIDADVSTISKHLSVMKNAGLIVSEKRAQKVFYRLNVPCIVNFFECVERVVVKHREDNRY